MGSGQSSTGHQVRYHVSEAGLRGSRETMEDAHIHCQLPSHSNIHFFGVFDGHGGTNTPQYVKQNLHLEFDRCLGKESSNALALVGGAAFTTACILTDENYLRAYPRDASGSTAVCAAIDLEMGHLLCANIGDAQAVLSRAGTCVSLSQLHKPSVKEEKDRIDRTGHSVLRSRIDGALAVSRSFGDRFFKHTRTQGDADREKGQGLLPDRVTLHPSSPPAERACCAIPHIQMLTLSPLDEFVVLGCDGLFDVMSDQGVVDFVRGRLIAARGTEVLYKTSAVPIVQGAPKNVEVLESSGPPDDIGVLGGVRGMNNNTRLPPESAATVPTLTGTIPRSTKFDSKEASTSKLETRWDMLQQSATELAEYAINTLQSKDNVSIIIIYLDWGATVSSNTKDQDSEQSPRPRPSAE